MTETESPLGERVAAVETDIKHVLDGIVRVEGSVARIENVVIKENAERLESGIARVDRRLTETKQELRSDIARVEGRLAETRADLIARVEKGLIETRTELKSDLARVEGRVAETKEDLRQTLLLAMAENRKALYVLCGTVIAGIVAALLKDSFL